MEILCLRAALRYDVKQQAFPLRGQSFLTKRDLLIYSELHILIPLLNYAQRLQDLNLDDTEAALLAAILSLQVLDTQHPFVGYVTTKSESVFQAGSARTRASGIVPGRDNECQPTLR